MRQVLIQIVTDDQGEVSLERVRNFAGAGGPCV